MIRGQVGHYTLLLDRTMSMEGKDMVNQLQCLRSPPFHCRLTRTQLSHKLLFLSAQPTHIPAQDLDTRPY